MLLEREVQLQTIAGYLAEAADGHGRLVFVAGEAGIGKTTFVDQVLADAARAATVASGTCDGSATPAPLGPLVEMLPQLPAGVWPPDATRQECSPGCWRPCGNLGSESRICSSSRTRTGPTKRPWTSSGT